MLHKFRAGMMRPEREGKAGVEIRLFVPPTELAEELLDLAGVAQVDVRAEPVALSRVKAPAA